MRPDPLPLSALDAAAAELARALPSAIDLLGARRAAEVPAARLDAYVDLGWMRWAAGRLVVTPPGTAMRDAVLALEDRP